MGVVWSGACTLSFNLNAEVTKARVESASVRRITTREVSPGSGLAGPTSREVTKDVCEAELVFSARDGEQIRLITTRLDVIGCMGNTGRLVSVAYDPANPLHYELREATGVRGAIQSLIVGAVMIVIALVGLFRRRRNARDSG